MSERKAVSYIRHSGCSFQGTLCLPWWTNVLYDEEGFCLGGDAHWLSAKLADEAVEKNGWIKR